MQGVLSNFIGGTSETRGMGTQLSEALEVSLDYLVGSTDILLDKNIVAKILDIQKLKENDRQHVFALLDVSLNKLNCKAFYKTTKPLKRVALLLENYPIVS